MFNLLILMMIGLEDPKMTLGTKIGQCIRLSTEDRKQSRYYVPISRTDDEGVVDLMVRIYRKAHPDPLNEQKPGVEGYLGEHLETLKVEI
jgi:hypothetical protein